MKEWRERDREGEAINVEREREGSKHLLVEGQKKVDSQYFEGDLLSVVHDREVAAELAC